MSNTKIYADLEFVERICESCTEYEHYSIALNLLKQYHEKYKQELDDNSEKYFNAVWKCAKLESECKEAMASPAE